MNHGFTLQADPPSFERLNQCAVCFRLSHLLIGAHAGGSVLMHKEGVRGGAFRFHRLGRLIRLYRSVLTDPSHHGWQRYRVRRRWRY